MLQFILRRLGLVIPTFIGITLLTFAFVHMIPGDPVMIMAGERGISPERHAQLLAELGLDKPMWQQYLHYIWGVLHGDLGISLKSRLPVWDEFVPRFKATLELGVCAMIFATAVGIPVGVLAAVKRGSIFDHTAVGLALTGYSMPIFWWGMMLIMLVSVQLNLTPVSGRVSDMVFLDDSNPLTGFMLIDTAIWGEEGNFIDAVAHMILPAMVLGTIPLAVIVRMTRSSMLEVLGEDYIRTARAKGLTRMRVIADVDEADIGQVADGQRVQFSVDAYPDDTFEGTVLQVRLEATTESNVVTYEVVIDAPNPDLKLKPGLTANVTIFTLEKDDATAVPTKALRFVPNAELLGEIGLTAVETDSQAAPGSRELWVKEGTTLRPRRVYAGAASGDMTEITEGLTGSEEIVTGLVTAKPREETAAIERSPFMPGPPGSNDKKK